MLVGLFDALSLLAKAAEGPKPEQLLIKAAVSSERWIIKAGFPAMFGLLSSAPDERDFAGLECDQAIANRTESF